MVMYPKRGEIVRVMNPTGGREILPARVVGQAIAILRVIITD